jgi:hypothetical protein
MKGAWSMFNLKHFQNTIVQQEVLTKICGIVYNYVMREIKEDKKPVSIKKP